MAKASDLTSVDIASVSLSSRSPGIHNEDDGEDAGTQSFSNTDQFDEDITDANFYEQEDDANLYDQEDDANLYDQEDDANLYEQEDVNNLGEDGNPERKPTPILTAEDWKAGAEAWESAGRKVRHPLRIRIWIWICVTFWSFVPFVRSPPDYITDSISIPMKLPRLKNKFWPRSKTSYFGKAWSYEVTTGNAIYRISTNPTDYLGTVRGEWPKELREGWSRYKAPEIVMYEVKGDYQGEFYQKPSDQKTLCRLQRETYLLARDAAESRIAFLRKWPNAFEKDGNADTHWYYPLELIGKANEAQIKAVSHCSQAGYRPCPGDAALPPIDERDIRGLRVYAIGPRWYETLRKREKAKKKREWQEVQDPDNWQATLNTRPSLSRPSLPPLKWGVRPWLISDLFFACRKIYMDVMGWSEMLDPDVVDKRWLKYM